ncbi:NAD-dependent epimerase/dehydratase family protein [Lutibacter holmesii]|uniref:UDP-glucose 4-epimerase n=1 Tax=Lutibacter holmesii TaxID=1137985 RepID=A0ABW3WP64_9FLAO
MKKSSILVTGGASFVGAKLCEALLQLKYTVVCLDNFSTGKMDAIKHLVPNPNFKLIGGDIRNEEDCKKACKHIDLVVHQAVLNQATSKITNAVAVHTVNTIGFVNIITAAQNAHVKGVMYCNKNQHTSSQQPLETAYNSFEIAAITNKLYVQLFEQTYHLPIQEITPQHISKTATKEANAIGVQTYVKAITQLCKASCKLV